MATCLAGNNQLNIGVVGFALMQSIWQHKGHLVQKNNTCDIPPKSFCSKTSEEKNEGGLKNGY